MTVESYSNHPLHLQTSSNPKFLYQQNTMLRDLQTPYRIRMTYKLGKIYSWQGDLGR